MLFISYQSAVQDISNYFESTMAWFSSSTSAMDLHTAVICAGVFVVSALVVYLISVFGMRERTYEEAIEEQRRRNLEAIQQAKSDKSKKEKKFKKWGRKSKEKNEEEKSISCDSESKTAEETEVKEESDANGSLNQTPDSKSSVKKKSRQRKVVVTEKGDEVTHQISSSDDTDETPSGNSISGNTQTANDENTSLVMDDELVVKEEINLDSPVEKTDDMKEKTENLMNTKSVKKSPSRKNKKNKLETSEFSTDAILNKVLGAVNTDEEIQQVVDALLSKHKGLNNEKKKNEISALKKILSEKEEALKVEQKQCHAANEKINDLIQELKEQKAQALSTEKSLKDAVNQEQQEIKALHGMMQRKREQYASEISSLQSKMQQMKSKMKDEHTLAVQRLQEEINQLQNLNRIETEKQQRSNLEISRLQHEVEQLRSSRDKYETHQAAMQQSQEDLHLQVQQLEKNIKQLMSSHQEEEYSYKQRINEMSNKIQQTENARSSLVQELQNAQSVCSSLEADNASLRQRFEEAKHQLKNSEQDIMQLRNSLEESNRQQREMANCLEKMRSEVMDLTNTNHEQMQIIQSLKEDNETLAAQLTQNMERMVADGSEQNHQESEKKPRIDLEEHETLIQEKENSILHLLSELDNKKREIVSIINQLECEKQKNKEFCDKNKELTDALNKAENKLKETIETAERQIHEAQMKADAYSKDMQIILNEKIKEVERSLKDSYTKELQSVRDEAESIRKDAEERILKAETQANLQLEEFQESLYARLSQLNCESEAKVAEAEKLKERIECKFENLNQSIRTFLKRLFSELPVPESFDETVLNQFESQVKSYLKSTEDRWSCGDTQNLESVQNKLIELEEQNSILSAQLTNYETVLAETENMLTTLQIKAELEEAKWKKELLHKNEAMEEIISENENLKGQNKNLRSNLEKLQDLNELLSENENLKVQNKNLQTSLEELQNLKETFYEMEELRLKLRKEELEKKLLQERLEDSLTNNSPFSIPDSNLTHVSEVNGASGKK